MGVFGKVVFDWMIGDVCGILNYIYIGGYGLIFYEYLFGGIGGWFDLDGNMVVCVFNEGENVLIQLIEVVEVIYLMWILCNEVCLDSGGFGIFCGGCGLVCEVEMFILDVCLLVLLDCNIVLLVGVNGGVVGVLNCYMVCCDGYIIMLSDFFGKIVNFELCKGDVVVMESFGGGGFGDLIRWDVVCVDVDLIDGYVIEVVVCVYC